MTRCAGVKGAASLERVDVIQPALFAVMVSLAGLWRSCGVTPAAVVGHSQGEVAAAHVAGGLSLEDAALIAAVRSRLLQERAGEGGMVSVALPAGALEAMLEPFGDRLSVAAQNGPAAAIVSGDRKALDRLLEACSERGVRARDLAGGIFASHSAYVEPMREEVIAALSGISPRSGSIPFHSTVTAGLLDTAGLDASYWYRNLRQPVRFEAVTRQLLEQGRRSFIEISAHPVFAVAVGETIEDALSDPEEATVLATLRRDQGGPEHFARSLAEAHVAGVSVDWQRFFGETERLELPTYPFQRRRCWLDETAGDDDGEDLGVAAGGAPADGLAAELATLPVAEREARLLALVRAEVARVLGQGSAEEVEPDRAFKQLGFDSAAAADLRRRLRAASGLRIGSTAVFDHPTASGLARHLLALAGGERAGGVAVRATASGGPIAIVGMACRLPGASSPRQLWRLLAEAGDATSEFPEDRGWDRERLFDPDPERPGTTYASRGGFLAGAGDFDAGFFEISPREALAMDPQQRLLLEASWEAFESAGLDPGGLRGTATGVFAGISSQDYSAGLRAGGDAVEGYRLTGSASSVASGRISYTLGLEGPAMTVDTACSSSLVAMHLAAAALRAGECSLALAGGATVLGSPGVFTEFSRQRGLAPDGRCKSFAEAADGTAWAEGVGVLVLERLSDAEANGHRVLATIRGSAVNQDGASNGLTAPNGPSQERVIRQALANAGLKPSDVDMVEAHGTGTALGDPIEAGALLATYGQERETPVRLGSLKSNIGHAQAAAGVAGVIKAVLAMREGVMPKTLHVDAPSSKVEWESGAVELLAEAMPWPEGERPRRAAVSSFGISGTNAHTILEEAPAPSVAGRGTGGTAAGPGASAKERPFLLSARSAEALADQAGQLAAHLEANPEQDLGDFAFSLATTRAQLEQRAVVVAAERRELSIALTALAQAVPLPAGAFAGSAVAAARLAYLFSGQGSQRPGMGKELYETHPAYSEALDAACAEIDPLIGRSLAELIFSEPGSEEAALLDHTTYAQPALFATELALHRLLESLGLTAELLCGHSVGEITAAHIAGVFDLPDAARLVCARGALMGELPAGGAMLAIEATEAEVLASIEGREAELSLAAVNSPDSCVLSGTEAAVEALEAHWREAGRRTSRLAVSHAFHSHLMEPMLAEFEQVARGLSFARPEIPVVSCMSGELLSAEQATDPAWWVSHARLPVRFGAAVATLRAEGATAFLELGPDPVLTAMAEQSLDGEAIALIPTLREGKAEGEALNGALAQAWTAGAPVEWSAFFAGAGARVVTLPTYPFQRQRYWLSAGEESGGLGAAGIAAADHPMLGARLESPDGGGLVLSGRLSPADQPWLADHVIFGAVILPGTGFLELALRAADEVGAGQVEELTLQAPLVFRGERPVQLQVVVSDLDEEGRREISIHSRPEGDGQEWTRHAAGALLHSPQLQSRQPLDSWPPPAAEPVEVESFYELIAERGLELGPSFHCLNAAWRDGESVYAEVALAAEQRAEAGRFQIHPVLLDAALHTTMLNADTAAEHRELGARLPFSWRNVSLGLAGADSLRVRAGLRDGWDVVADFTDADGTAVATIESLALRPVASEQFQGKDSPGAELLGLEWVALAGGESADPAVETWQAPRPGGGAEAAREAVLATLEKLQDHLASGGEESRLAILTEGALAAGEGEAPDPGAAAIAGLVGSAAGEHPGRFLIVDSDGSEASRAALEGALAADPREPRIALREGELLAPRLVAGKAGSEAEPNVLDPDRTVLISGGTGGIGALVAQHLVEAHGARSLLLASRSGAQAPGALDLRARLQEHGAEVEIAACDVSDRGQLEALLAAIPAEQPLGAVVHCAAVLDDATVEAADAGQLERVFAAKAAGAWNLHELTREAELSHFSLFSSIAGTLGSPGQGAYAAANCFLDALAAERRAAGLPATSIAWGLWGAETAMASRLGEADLARMGRIGIEALTAEQGLALFDAALALPRPFLAAARFDRAALRAQAAAGVLPALLTGLVPASPRRPASSLATRLATVPEAEREEHVLDLVRSEVATVLGHGTAKSVGPGKAFKELGFDSLAAVELRNRLKASTGVRLASTAVFDHPTAAALAAHLLSEVAAGGPVKKRAVRAQTSEEPIAIVGIGCHLPGGIDSPEQLWDLVAEGRDAIVPFPADRGWDLARIYDPDPEHAGTSYVREGGFLADPASFDAEFFAIAPREALAMDPQQRLLLETSWEALEDAGIDPGELRGQAAGVFAGAAKGDYSSAVEGYKMLGGLASILAGRVAYTLGLEGPAMTVDTACSSSLVAMHLAIAALQRGECSLALAGGVTVHATPGMFVDFSRQRVLSPDGRSKSFAAGANGAGWSEGVGMLVLERLSAAERNGRRVLATIRGSAVNQDGASNGLSAPNGPAQERVIRQALANAGLGPAEVDAVEAHGTGTALGDPIEAGAVIATYGAERERPLKLGSIKSNIGHTLGAAGVAGVIKMTMAMRAGVLPKTLHADPPSPAVDWSAAAVELLTESQEWEAHGRPRRAAVSSFGISGTNAHLILEEAPTAAAGEGVAPGSGSGAEAGERPLVEALPLVLSAKSEPALRAQAERLAADLRERPGLELADVAYSLALDRACFERRAVAVGTSREQLLESLDALAAGAAEPPRTVSGSAAAPAKAAFLFPGQGSQWQGMALELLDSSPVFARSMEECEQALAPHLDFVLADVLAGNPGAPSLERIEVVQPALFAVMVSLARLWQACGLEPAAVAGHSQGEIAAAHIAGGLSLEDAARLAALRSSLISKLAGKGGMVSLITAAERVAKLIAPWDGAIEVAAHNGPSSTIVSGTREALDQLLASCEGEEGVRAREVPAAIASHSHHVEGLREEVLEAFADLAPRSGSIPFHSTVTGGPLDTAELDASYWYRNLRQPVLFEQVCRGLLEGGHRALIEVSPHPVFPLAVAETIERAGAAGEGAAVIETLRREEGGAERFALSLATAHASGAPLEWRAFFAGSGARSVPLPTYPFQRKRYWLGPSDQGQDAASLGQDDPEHPLLGAAIEDPGGGTWAFTGRISLATHPWLADHAVAGTTLLPGTAFLELALRAGATAGTPFVEELTMQAPLLLPEQGAVQVRVSVSAPDGEGRREIEVHHRPEAAGEAGDWVQNASGVLAAAPSRPPREPAAWPPPGAEPLEVESLYDRLAAAGFEYGPEFQGLSAAWRDGEAVHAELALSEQQAGQAQGFELHPALLDAALHAVALLSGPEAEIELRLPLAWSGVGLGRSGASSLRASISPLGEGAVALSLADGDGVPLGEIDQLEVRALDPAWQENLDRPLEGLLALEWRQASLAAPGEPPARLAELPAAAAGEGAAAARRAVGETLRQVQEWLASEESEGGRMAIVTRGAVSVSEAETADPVQSAVAGLLRSVQSEHPERFLLIDSDGSAASEAALAAALADGGGEPQLALREGRALVPRLTRLKAAGPAAGPAVDPERTVLITGGTSGLGALLARHLVERHGACHLLLLSRSGPGAKGAEELRGELEQLGAEVEIVACDVAEREALADVLAAIPAARPLGMAIHAAGVLADGTVESIDAAKLDLVFGPKALGAWNLHELTAGADLPALVLFSSIAGTVGSVGQANYAAANAFLDGLASARRGAGLPTTSIAWGLWGSGGGMAAGLGEADLARMRRLGIGALSADKGLALFDAALAAFPAQAVPVELDRAALRSAAAAGTLPPILSGLAGAAARPRARGSLGAKLAELAPAEQEAQVLSLVQTEVAAVLGHGSAAAIDPRRAFKELGFDSLAAVELRNRLKAATGLRLRATAVFDHPSPAALARHLLAETSGEGAKRRVVRARASQEPIAIVGMACRFPAGASSPERLWQLVADGRDGVGEFPADRGWPLERLYDLDPDRPGTSYTREGGFLDSAGDFDADFFGVSPREATAMDPQQRLLLETSWEALEAAGVEPGSLRESPTGIFVGVAKGDYDSALEGHRMIGGLASVVAGRIAYTLDLQGPAISVDTACSSSLVALHLAIGALRAGECSLALAGGATVLSTPETFIEFSRQRVLSADGRCKSFSEQADGTGFAEGAGMLLVERLSDARRNGHSVLAIVRGSAVNQDGASNGLSAPNGPSQERVIRQALADAGLGPADVDAVEAHGTGTPLGDPIEAGALIATYGQDREVPLRLGSIKSNIGHTAAAAGVAGVIKMTMAMRAGVLPKTLHVDSPSSKIGWEAGRVELLTEQLAWEPGGRPRRAAVSSFGISGTNAHLILEEAPTAAAGEGVAQGSASGAEAGERPLVEALPLVLSAKSEPALRAQAERLAADLRERPDLELADVAYSLALDRACFERRAVAVGTSREQLLESLDALAAGAAEPPRTVSGSAAAPAKAAFLFPGQGSQWQGMALELLDSSPVFAAAMEQCEQALAPHLDFVLADVLAGNPGAPSLERIEVVQPALFAVMVSLARLWQACGLEPAAVAGHSQGEIAAAHIAGGLSLEDAARLAALRSSLISKLAGKGGMVSLITAAERVAKLIAPWDGAIEVAAHNGPSSTIVSGTREALDQLLASCEGEEGVRAREVPAAIASHSHHVEGLREEVLEAFADLAPRSGSIPFHSTVTGGPLDTAELDASYWYRNLRQPVLFEQVCRGLLEGGHRALIEVSPHPVFPLAVAETIERAGAAGEGAAVIETLRREEGGAERFALSLATAHASGAPLEWRAFFAGSGARSVPLPTYPFQRKRYWLAPASAASDPTAIGQGALDHPFLAAAIEEPEGEGIAFSGRLSLAEHPWLKDHAVLGQVLLPGTAFLELALFAGAQAATPTVEELTLQAPLVLGEGAVALRVSLSAPDQRGRREIAIHSRAEGEEQAWARNAAGTLSAEVPAAPEPLVAWPPPGAEQIEPDQLHARLAEAGFEYGPAFQGLTAAWREGQDLYAEVSLPAERAEEAQGFGVHPALLDASLHPIALAAGEGAGLRLPFSWSGVSIVPGSTRELRARISGAGAEGASLLLFDGAGTPLGHVDSLLARPLDPAQLQGAAKAPLHRLRWGAPAPPQTPAPATEAWSAPPAGSGAEAAREAVLATLEKLQAHLASAGDSRLAVLLEGALPAGEGEAPATAAAAIAGLLRSAAAEHPGRFLLVDTDGSDASAAALGDALALDPRESQVALREGELLVPRLARAEDAEGGAARLDPERTVLISGGTGGIGALIARHLVAAHGARHLLLASRSGDWARGGRDLGAELERLGAEVEIAACDVSDRGQLEALLDSIPAAHPLGAVVHCAAVLDDATVETAGAEQLARVFAPKADAAWHLHELTEGSRLSHFVCLSSAAGTIGSPGQGAYAAANCFLDALAAQRHAAGLPATSIAWGLWQSASNMLDQLAEADLARMRRAGLAALPPEQGLALFDAALAAAGPFAVAARFDRAALAAQAAGGSLPALLEGLAPARARTGAGGALARRLREAPEGARRRLAEDFVRAEVAAILGHSSPEAVGPDDSFKDLGFDSLAAIELRNRLGAACGRRLSATVVFDYPDAGALAGKLIETILGGGDARPAVERVRSSAEPIAIVGMACRFPGGVSSPAELWQLLRTGSDAVGELPDDRGWDPEGMYVLDPERPELGYRRAGGFLTDAGDFDPGFFGISPREAVTVDPQQRLALESSWEALEDAGIDPHGLRRSATGVFTGVMHHDYGVAVSDSSGMAAGAASGRVSYALGLEGPAMTVDTACSSSLVAMHLAAAALRAGECSLALAGGATVLATSAVFGYFSRQQGLARDGRCKAFSDEADGLGIAEGVGVLVLERLSDAEANGHHVLATIRGSAVNQDGASNGLTAPNGPSQERVIRQALANAGLKPSDVDMVEAHGTGTALGDPIEAGALLATYGQERETPVRLGSLKSNIGHAQAAAGVAGVIKAVLAMREGVMPKTLHVDAPSSKVEWDAGKLELLRESLEWEANGHPRRAGVSSFGATGTNAHLILEEGPAPAGVDPEAGAPPAGPHPLLLSARSPQALAAQAGRLGAQLREHPEQGMADVAFSLATTRAQLEQRAVVVADEREQLLGALDALAREEQPAGVILGHARAGAKLAYLFSGQGSQRPGMGGELYETHPPYAEALDAACAQIDPLIGRSLAELIFSEPGSEEAALLDHTTYAQPALFATELALHRLLESLGLTAELLCGHSVGEITAAHVAGVFDLPDAARLVCARGALMGELPAGGAMLAIEATEEQVLASIEGREAELSLAAVNSPDSCVLSGTEAAVEALEAHWREAGKKTKRLAVSHAFHSPLMEPMLEPFAELCATLTYNPPRLSVVSCLDGELLGAEAATDPARWVAHARQPVRFAAAIETLRAEGAGAYLELGPDPVLCAMARQCLGEGPALAPALRRDREEAQTLTGALATAHASGAPLEWRAFFAGSGARSVPLPTYPFQRKRYWLAPASAASDPTAIGQGALDHPFLAAAIEEPEGEGIAFSGRLSLAEHPWLKDHAVLGQVLLPGTAFLELALFAGAQAATPTVEELTLQAPLVLGEGAVALRVSLSAPDQRGRREIAIHSRAEGEEQAWARNAAGTLSAEVPAAPEPLVAWPPPGAEQIEPDQLHARLAEAGFEYGPAFQGLTAAWREGQDLYAEVSLPAERAEEAQGFGVHPALLDASLHPIALAAGEQLRLPLTWSGAWAEARGARELRARISGGAEDARVELFDPIGAPIGAIGSLLTRPLDPAQIGGGAKAPLFALHWTKPIAAPAAAAPTELWRAPEPGLGALGARGATLATLGKLQAWLAADSRDSRLAILAEGALIASEADSLDPAAAALSGLVGAAASEHPGRFLLIDTDGSEASEAALERALEADPRETRIALREGELFVPRLTAASLEEAEVQPLDPERTVLITGASGGLGSLIARHLVESHGARQLLLTSRSGESARGAAELSAELRERGAEVVIAACDVSDREQLEQLLGSIPAEHSLGAVVHCAAVLDDATIESASPDQVERVFAPKADAAAHLDELTRGQELSHFVLFSSLAGLLGSPGQGAYAAANAFLDGLAVQRRAAGLPASSIAWGLWQSEDSMVGALGASDLARMRRAGIEALSVQRGLALFDAALVSPRPLSAAVRFDRGALRAQAGAGALPLLLAELAPLAVRRENGSGEFLRRLREAPEAARERLAEDFVRAEVAAILGHSSPEAVGPDDSFKDLGFDSLAAIELRNRLGAACGRRLPASVVFDYPTAAALATHLLGEGEDAEEPAVAPSRVAARLAEASDEELLEFIDTQVGSGRG